MKTENRIGKEDRNVQSLSYKQLLVQLEPMHEACLLFLRARVTPEQKKRLQEVGGVATPEGLGDSTENVGKGAGFDTYSTF